MSDQGSGAADEPAGEVVLEGVHRDMTWQVRVHGDEVRLHSMVYLYRGNKLFDGGGIGGAPLRPGSLIAAMRGYSDHAPAQVLVRTHPDVVSVVATTERNVRVDVPLSPVIQPWGLRFGVAVLDDGDTIGGLSVYTADGQGDKLLPPPAPLAPPPGSDSGWFPR